MSAALQFTDEVYVRRSATQHPYVQRVKQRISSGDPKVKAAWQSANAALCAKALTPGVVHVDTTLSNISVQYANADYIGIQLMPVVKVAHLSDRFFVYDKRSRLAYPDDFMGARSSPNELQENLTTDNYSCKSYGYKEYVDNLTLRNQTAPLDEMIDIVANINEGLAFREELRIASIAGNAANYGGNTTTLGGSAYWTATGGNPITDVQNAVAALWQGRGAGDIVAFCSLDVFNQLTRSAPMLELLKYTRPGLAAKDEIARILGVNRILVGAARKDTANESQAASYARIWPNVFGVARVATTPGIRNAAFGYTFRFGDPATDQWYDPSLGPMGGYYARVSVTEDHKIVAPDTAFLITNPIG